MYRGKIRPGGVWGDDSSGQLQDDEDTQPAGPRWQYQVCADPVLNFCAANPGHDALAVAIQDTAGAVLEDIIPDAALAQRQIERLRTHAERIEVVDLVDAPPDVLAARDGLVRYIRGCADDREHRMQWAAGMLDDRLVEGID